MDNYMNIYYYTFGCKVNQYETENIRQALEKMGHTSCGSFADADACVINTCTVTAQSDTKCAKLIRRIRSENPDCIIAAAGCMTQTRPNHQVFSLCDILVGSQNKTDIPQLIDGYVRGERVVRIVEHSRGEKIEKMSNGFSDGRTRAYIKIQDGCDMNCSYCIIPQARGHIRSRPPEDIAAETAALTAAGHKEIILTGINLGCYGRDLGNTTRLTDAAAAACSADGDFRVRLSSLEPELISEEDIALLADMDKLCPHFHISLQSGCADTLRRMNRRYSPDDLRLLCRTLRRYFPDCALTADIMVGFPGESEDDFRESLECVRELALADAHIFRYSRRPGTQADRMSDQVDARIKQQRAALMHEVCADSQKEYLAAQVGKVLRVLFEKETSPQFYQGHTDSYIMVKVPKTEKERDISLRRQFRMVEILSAEDGWCIGRITE